MRARTEVMDERQLPSLTPNQLEALRQFALLEIREEELQARLAGVFEVHFETWCIGRPSFC
jgi:hypothetical protein